MCVGKCKQHYTTIFKCCVTFSVNRGGRGAILHNSVTKIKQMVILSVKHFELLGVYDKLHSNKLEEQF